MKPTQMRHTALALLVGLGAYAGSAQSTIGPLALQGIDRQVFLGARSTGMGGAAVAACGDAGALFVNPAALSQLNAPEVRAGFSWTSTAVSQEQSWIPNRFYPNFTLLMENMTGSITPPVVTNPRDDLQRPFDDLSPNWDAKSTRFRPTMAVAAIPFTLGGMTIVAAAGFTQAADLDFFAQNHNGLDPNIGLYRPAPMPVLRGTDTLAVRWFTSSAERRGVITGITPGVSVMLSEQFSAGASLTILTGHSDDVEYRRDRGLLSFDAVYRVVNYPIAYRTASTGRSDYSGTVANLGLFFRERYFTLAASLKLPSTITREWSQAVTRDSAGVITQTERSGSDALKLPANYSFGLLLTPTSEWNLGIDYVVGSLGDAVYTPAGSGIGREPWLSANVLRAGAEYLATDWLAVRFGYRDIARTFAPEGTGLIGNPVTGSVYAGGVGVSIGMIRCDLAYEYQRVAYQDLWETNVNDNSESRHAVMLEVAARF